MTERTLREQIASLPRYESDEVGMDKCTEGNWLSRAEVLALLDAHTAAQPAPDAVAEAAKVLLSQPKKADSPFAEAFFIACAYLEDDPCGIETTNEIIETFLKTLAGEND